MINALLVAYPEHQWATWKFNNLPNSYWLSEENQKNFILGVAPTLGVRTLLDWENITTQQLIDAGGMSWLSAVSDGIELNSRNVICFFVGFPLLTWWL
jgi:hypothetical protein